MTDKEEYEIIRLLTAPTEKQRSAGVNLFIKTYERKVRNWIKRQEFNTYEDDIWIEAAHLMIRAIQAEKYAKIPGVSLYTYFHTIVYGAWYRYYQREVKEKNVEDIEAYAGSLRENETPHNYLELKELLDALEYCLNKMGKAEKDLLKEIILNSKKLVDLVEVFGLKNYNNAKQKYFKIKKELINCLKFRGI